MRKRKVIKNADLQKKKSEKEYAEMNKMFFCVFVLIFTLIAAFSVFEDLSFSGIIIEWDEARHGINAYEMLKSKNFIANTYQYETDYWNVKPPLSMWQIALAYKLFGYNTFSLRFFSALYLPLIVAVSMVLLKRYVGFISALVTGFLFATTGTRFFHLFKSGDPDALFFFTCFVACVFLYLAYREKPKYLIGAGIFTAFAFLTKAMHVATLFLVIFVYLIFTLKNRVFSMKQLLLYLIIPMAAPVLLWGLWRVGYDGIEFFRQMYLLDVLNRVTTVVENHSGGVDFYIIVVNRVLGAPMFYGLILSVFMWIILTLINRKESKTDIAFLIIFGTMALAPLIIFTISVTKLAWYVFPCVIGIYFVAGYALQKMAEIFLSGKKRVYVAVCLSACVIFLLIGGFTRPFKFNINLLTTDVTSSENIFSKTQVTSGTPFLVVDSQGLRTGEMMQSWLLQAYYLELDYVLHGMERFEDYDNALIILRHDDEGGLESFCASYPQLEVVAQASDYTRAIYTALQ